MVRRETPGPRTHERAGSSDPGALSAQAEPMRIYNLFPLLAGPLGDWEPHLERAATMGFDWVFVNPIQQPGRSGSLYSIADYFQINRALLGPRSRRRPDTQVKEVVAQAQRLADRVAIVVKGRTVNSGPLHELVDPRIESTEVVLSNLPEGVTIDDYVHGEEVHEDEAGVTGGYAPAHPYEASATGVARGAPRAGASAGS